MMKQATRQYVHLQPLAEQHRIAAEVNALMALCDRLEVSHTATTRSKFLHDAGKALGPALEAVDA